MIEVIFTLDGIEKKEMAVFDTIKQIQSFLQTFKDEVLEQYPNATNIKLGKCYTGI